MPRPCFVKRLNKSQGKGERTVPRAATRHIPAAWVSFCAAAQSPGAVTQCCLWCSVLNSTRTAAPLLPSSPKTQDRECDVSCQPRPDRSGRGRGAARGRCKPCQPISDSASQGQGKCRVCIGANFFLLFFLLPSLRQSGNKRRKSTSVRPGYASPPVAGETTSLKTAQTLPRNVLIYQRLCDTWRGWELGMDLSSHPPGPQATKGRPRDARNPMGESHWPLRPQLTQPGLIREVTSHFSPVIPSLIRRAGTRNGHWCAGATPTTKQTASLKMPQTAAAILRQQNHSGL